MSNPGETGARETVVEQARHWIVELDAGDLSPGDLARLAQWLDESPVNRETFDRLRQQWRRMDAVQRLGSGAADTAVVHKWVRKRHVRRAFVPVAVAAALAIVVGSVWLMQAPSVHEVEYRTAVGQQRAIVLPDESLMTINTDTVVRVRFTEEERRLALRRGEALFEVVPDNERPFVVAAGNGVVRAVGTAFAVYLREESVEVTVTEGTVEVAAAPAASGSLEPVQVPRDSPFPAHVLRERHKLKYGQEVIETVAVSEEEIRRSLAWRHGMLDFEAAPLSDVIAEANRYLQDRFIIKDPELETLEFTGYFRAGDVDLLIKLLESNEILRTTRADYRTVYITKAAEA
jgi:transmembrane sensor